MECAPRPPPFVGPRSGDHSQAVGRANLFPGALEGPDHGWHGIRPVGGGSGRPHPDASLDRAFPRRLKRRNPRLSARDVVHTFAGLLPAKTDTDLASRALVYDHGQHGGPQGLFGVLGVKLTTARRVAEKALKRLGRPTRCGRPAKPEIIARRPDSRVSWDLRAADLLQKTTDTSWRQALHRLIAEESVVHLDDLVLRRTSLWEDPQSALLLAPTLCTVFPWDALRCKAEQERLRRNLVEPIVQDDPWQRNLSVAQPQNNAPYS